MKAIKRTVAALLATLMLATSTSFTLAAENYSKEEAVAVAKVNAAGIMTGTENGFEPSKTLTRAEAAAIMVRMKGISESVVKTNAGTTLFSDVAASHWAAGYINVASTLGIINGVGNGMFAPDRIVTIAEFETMAIRALGAGQLVDSQGAWPVNYVNFANEEKISKNVYAIYTAEASRLNAAVIVANTIEAPMWVKSKVTTNKEVTWEKTTGTDVETIVSDVLGYTKTSLIVDKVSNNDQEVTAKTGSLIGAGVYDVNEKFDLTSIKVGLTYNAYYDADEKVIMGLWIEDESLEFQGIAKDVKTTDDEITLIVDGKEKTYKLHKDATTGDVDAKYTLNESATSPLVVDGKVKKNKNLFGSIVLNSKNEVTNLYITEYSTFGYVKEVGKSLISWKNDELNMASSAKLMDGTTAVVKASTSLKFNDDKKEYFFTKDGKSFDLKNLEEDDVIAYYTIGDKYVGIVVTDIVEGKVTATASDYVKVDGKKYEGFITGLNVGDEIVAYLNNAGEIQAYVDIEAAAGDVAVLSYFRTVNGKYASANDFEVELVYADGSKSDRMLLDLEGTANKFIEAQTGDPKTWRSCTKSSAKSAKEAAVRAEFASFDITTKVAGNLFEYQVNGDKVALGPVDATENFEEVALDKDKDSKVYPTLKVGNKTIALQDQNVVKYYITNNTKVLKLREDGAYARKVETVDIESLDDIKADITVSIIGYDKKTKEVDVVILGTDASIRRTAETNFVFIMDVASVKYEDKDAKEVEVVKLDGTTATYTYCANFADESISLSDSDKGTVVDFVVKDDMIMSKNTHGDDDDKLAAYTVGDYKYLREVYDNRVVLAKDADETHDEDRFIGNDLLVIQRKGAGTTADPFKYTVKSIDEVDKYDAGTTKNDTFVGGYTYTDDVETDVVVLLFENLND